MNLPFKADSHVTSIDFELEMNYNIKVFANYSALAFLKGKDESQEDEPRETIQYL